MHKNLKGILTEEDFKDLTAGYKKRKVKTFKPAPKSSETQRVVNLWMEHEDISNVKSVTKLTSKEIVKILTDAGVI